MQTKNRLLSIDWLRGFIMILMTIDHASLAFNSGRLVTDSIFLYKAGTVLAADQFFLRWITHMCAPGFLLLAGVSLALSTEKRIARGECPRQMDRHVMKRGVLLIAIDILWMSLLVRGIILQVLYAIGFSFICMPAIRRLSNRWLWGISLSIIFGLEAVTGLLYMTTGRNVVVSLFFSGGMSKYFLVIYPVLPWLAMMMLGWILGRSFLKKEQQPFKLILLGGMAVLVFVIIRFFNSYGNFLLYRDDFSIVQWLHVSKYPPALAFISLELGLIAIFLGLFQYIEQAHKFFSVLLKPIQVLGQTALFYYILHMHVLVWTAQAMGMYQTEGINTTLVSSLCVIIVLLPCCYFYRKLKSTYPNSWLRYI
ncbi:DUF1624 domain-containing protein [Candidatus Uabimicrobium amorphum]|uniref:Ribonuclease HI n=1 Tax=Uabimicrobium amorphum TaxID=2596890 RepID=A0A5S9ITW3_UABAM|nr:heparan-alpha-glucosaminide N-acetyltransferase domain-containing protein [Candidatus Uabimicrobium amorphum]BBM86505.1 ribonuclease HI [Candidatus Uabimicrobium amorphum]